MSQTKTNPALAEHAAQIAAQTNWQDKYRLLMKLGSQLNKNADVEQIDANLVHGCESQVWLTAQKQIDCYRFSATSDSRIVSGLIMLLLEAINQQTAEFIMQFNLTDYFDQLGLNGQMSQSRTSGISAVFDQAKELINR
ncbi:SufE family protein [Catenovulum sp. 2E275]|uniref:SufE family protein n=1 Tax=Catenovulum sp. 2E275 TaxID=2980497 RepID=UPI0021D124E0|nr:SufE family protein [Catenovulum sp. 2E275]MCU4676493.1 SufE family protein [Catenovulum sp. 2E275]